MAPVRVLVVDDSVVVRRLVTDALSADPDIEVVGTAPNGRLALTKLAQVSPDVITLDIEMPEMDGLAALRQLRADGHRLPVIMFSTLTERGAAATLDALAAGASDYVTKPANVGSIQESIEQVRSSLVPKIKALVPRRPSVRMVPARRRSCHAELTVLGERCSSPATDRTGGSLVPPVRAPSPTARLTASASPRALASDSRSMTAW